MRDTNILGKEQAFKAAIVNQFNCETFEEFIDNLRERMNYVSRVPGNVVVYGHDAYNNWFRLHVKSFRYQPLNNCIILTIYYKWETSSDKESNWHEEDLVMYRTTYAGYKRNADRIYRKNKPHDDAVDALSYTVSGPHIDTDDPCWDLINPDLSNKEKENKEMRNEHKIIINHNAVIAIDGKYKSAVVLKKGEKWNTKLGVVMALAKFTRKDLYEILCTIKNPGEATVDCVSDMLQMSAGDKRRIKTFKWYQDAIKTERPALGKQVSIDITYEEA